MTIPKPSPSAKKQESASFSILASLIAFALIVLCLWASQWQYHRGVDRHHRNFIISMHVAQPSLSLSLASKDLNAGEWRSVTSSGTFDSDHQILLRNQYSDGKYGFDLLTLFHDENGVSYWVDRGWVSPGATALSTPLLPATSSGKVSITARLRLQRSLPQGSFFAVTSSGKGDLISKWNAQSNTQVKTEIYYLDLLSVSDSTMTPAVPVVLPELTDGPHMAYALQWLFFGGLVIYGRLLLRRSR